MQKAPVLKGSGLTPIDDDKAPVHVFGKNLEDRVVTTVEPPPDDQEEETCEEEEEEDEVTATEDEEDGPGDNANGNEALNGDDGPRKRRKTKKVKRKKTKKEETREERKEEDIESIKKRKFDQITGEEDEETAFQGEFKLFAWDTSTTNWIERGRGQLKLNDSNGGTDGPKYRLIMRTTGTYRIILNVAIQHPTFKVIAKNKTNIRFTDSLHVWAASGSNARDLGDLIEDRLQDDELYKKWKKENVGSSEPTLKPTDRSEDESKDTPEEESREKLEGDHGAKSTEVPTDGQEPETTGDLREDKEKQLTQDPKEEAQEAPRENLADSSADSDQPSDSNKESPLDTKPESENEK